MSLHLSHHIIHSSQPISPEMSLPNAFVTLLTTSSYLPGALVLLHALQDLHPAPRDFQIVALVTPETVDAATIGELRRAGYDLVIGVEPIGSGKAGQVGLELMGKVVSVRSVACQGRLSIMLTDAANRPTGFEFCINKASSLPPRPVLLYSYLPRCGHPPPSTHFAPVHLDSPPCVFCMP